MCVIHSIPGRKVKVAIPVKILVCLEKSPAHCKTFVIMFWCNKCVQEGISSICARFLCSKMYLKVSGVEVLQKLGPVFCHLYNKRVINIPLIYSWWLQC